MTNKNEKRDLVESTLISLILQMFKDLDPDDILKEAGVEINKRHRTMVAKAMERLGNKFNKELAAVNVNLNPDATPYKNTFIRKVRDVESVRLNGRTLKDGSSTPMEQWGGYELLSYFFELYYNNTGKDFPIETPGVVYEKYEKTSMSWKPGMTRGMRTMNSLINVMNDVGTVKNYLEWWFKASLPPDISLSWGYLESISMINRYYNSVKQVIKPTTTQRSDVRLPEDFIIWIDCLVGIHSWVGEVKTQRQLNYVYEAWKHRLNLTSVDHPVVLMIKEAIQRGLLNGN
jgi:hypothetical protein